MSEDITEKLEVLRGQVQELPGQIPSVFAASFRPVSAMLEGFLDVLDDMAEQVDSLKWEGVGDGSGE